MYRPSEAVKARLFTALCIVVAACGAHRRVGPPPETSGFLDDYSLLREGDAGELGLVYHNPAASWRQYHAVLLEPVTLWRSGRKSLEPVPKEDLLRLITDFQGAVRTRLGEDFQFVDRPGPDVLRIRLGITDARAADPVLDVLTATRGTGRPHPAGDGPLDPETRKFLESAAIEGEIRDAATNVLLAEGVAHRRSDAPPLETWADVNRALIFWVNRVCTRLESRTGAR